MVCFICSASATGKGETRKPLLIGYPSNLRMRAHGLRGALGAVGYYRTVQSESNSCSGADSFCATFFFGPSSI
jgi:hypothetical protein